jgi:hypothetical protein
MIDFRALRANVRVGSASFLDSLMIKLCGMVFGFLVLEWFFRNGF